MKFAIFATKGFLPYIINHLEKDGHTVLFNTFSPDIDICIVENRYNLYKWYRTLKEIKKNNIKLINFINDIPFMFFQKGSEINSLSKNIQQFLYNFTNKHKFTFEYANRYIKNRKNSLKNNFIIEFINKYINIYWGNRQFFQKNYRKYLKQADLNLAVSKYTQYCIKKFLKLDVPLCYQCVNSDYLLSLPKAKIKYDAINISRIVKYKSQEVFSKAANELGLNTLVLGRYDDKTIKLDCPHEYIRDNKTLFDKLNQSSFYVDCSLFEGFGMTPVEAAYLDKISIVSNTYVHKDVLGDYPIYFKRNDVNDLIEKMKFVMESGVKVENKDVKKRYSSEAFKNRLMEHIENII